MRQGFPIDFIEMSVAARVVQGIYDRAQILLDFPEIGHVYRRREAGEIRILLHGHYRIAYRLLDSETIEVLGVFHKALDIDRYL